MNPATARQPINVSDIATSPLPLPPAMIAPLVSGLMWERMAELSGHMVMQLRRLGAGCDDVSVGKFELMVDEPRALTPIAAAHAWMVAMAQPAALEIRRIEKDEMVSAPSAADVAEITAVAILAGSENPRGSARRLTKVLQSLACDFATACHKRGANAQFQFARPLQSVSPVTHHTAVPLATCRLRAVGLSCAQLRDLLKELVHDRGALGGGELLVVSVF